MITCKTWAGAEMHSAFGTDELGLNAVRRTVTADCAVTLLWYEHGVVIPYQRYGGIASSACLHCLPIGSEELHEGVHELFSEIELLRTILAN